MYGPKPATYNGWVTDLFLPAETVLHHEIEVKRSRFLAEISRVSTPEEARLAIDCRKDEMPDARHHCTAFAVSVLDSSPLLHSSDDGEPSSPQGRRQSQVGRRDAPAPPQAARRG